MLVATHELDTDSGSEQVYNALDVCLTHEVFAVLHKEISGANVPNPIYNFELALQAPVLEMMLRGFKIDARARELGIQSTKADLERLDHIIFVLANAVWDKGLNPNSGVQLRSFFYEHLGIPPIAEWAKGEQTYPMNRKTIEQIEDYFQARPIAATILHHRDLQKQLQVLQTEVDNDWRMRTSYNIGGTKVGRFSSSKSPTGSGGNLQNISEGLRHILTADDGYVLCGIDAEQSDSRMVGYMCGLLFDDWTYLDACESGDLHSYVARLVWPELAWTGDLKKDRVLAEQVYYRHFSRRDQCKRLGHGANFLGKGPTLSKETHTPLNLVNAFLERYFDAFGCIQQWQTWTASTLQAEQQLTTIHGRKREFFDRTQANETIRKGLAFLAAAATADNLDLGMWKIWRHMPEVQLLAQIHDAVYFQFPDEGNDRNREVVDKAKSLLELPLISPTGRRFIVPTEAKLGYNFGNHIAADARKGTAERNPRGLRKLH